MKTLTIWRFLHPKKRTIGPSVSIHILDVQLFPIEAKQTSLENILFLLEKTRKIIKVHA